MDADPVDAGREDPAHEDSTSINVNFVRLDREESVPVPDVVVVVKRVQSWIKDYYCHVEHDMVMKCGYGCCEVVVVVVDDFVVEGCLLCPEK